MNDVFVDGQIKRVQNTIDELNPSDKEYTTAVANLEKLEALKTKDSWLSVAKPILISGAVHLAGMGLVMLFETRHVWTSRKVGNYVPKMK